MHKIFSKGFYNESSFRSLSFWLLLIVGITYFNSLFNRYSLDDEFVTVTNANNYDLKNGKIPNHTFVTKGIFGIKDAFRTTLNSSGVQTGAYRPILTSSFCIEYAVWGVNPFLSHGLNLVLYFIIIWLVFKTIATSLNFNLFSSFWITLLFALHPSHTEIISSLKGRDELLWFLFAVLAFKQYLIWLNGHNLIIKWRSAFLFLLFVIISLLSKTTAVLIFPLVVIYVYSVRPVFNIKDYSLSFLGVLVYILYSFTKKFIIIDLSQIRYNYFIENPLHVHKEFLYRLIAFVSSYGFYFKELLWPYKQLFYYGYNVIDVFNPINIYFIVGVIGLFFLFYLFIYKPNYRFLFFYFFISILPFSNIIPVQGIVAERYLFLPSIFYCGFLFKIFDQIYSQFFKNHALKVLVVLCLSYLSYNINRNTSWKNKQTLFEDDISSLSKSAKANNLIANHYFEEASKNLGTQKGLMLANKAKYYYAQSIGVYPDYAQSYHNMGVVYFNFLNQLDSALICFNKSLSIDTLSGSSAFAKSEVYFKLNKHDSSFYFLKKSTEYSRPDRAGVIKLLDFYFQNKDTTMMQSLFSRTFLSFSSDYDWNIRKANYYTLTGFFDSSMVYFEKAYFILPNIPLKWHILDNYNKNKRQEARERFSKKSEKIR
jgi:tetratricopeptide (TPR) repeat protein